MSKENAVDVHNGVLFHHKEEYDVICRKMDGTGNHQAEISQAQKTTITFSLQCRIYT
jgi:hypothetical protein